MRYLDRMSPAAYRTLEVRQPGFGGLNIEDLEYQLDISQSPDMLNMMVKNGSFGKRYGQKLLHTFADPILAISKYSDILYIQSGESIWSWDGTTATAVYTDPLITDKGIFIAFNRLLYFLNGNVYLEFDGTTWTPAVPYEPDICINRKPDGSYSDLIDDYNRLGAGFKNTFNGDGSSTEYVLTDDNLDATTVKAEVGTTELTEGTDFTVDRTEGKVTFNTAPASGQNNVVITAYKTEQAYIDSIMNNKYWATYGGQNNSRLFLAGNGNSTYYFSDVFDGTYFPETNYATIGNGEEDITGFGAQYNVLIVFKPTEMYAVSYSYTTDSNGDYVAQFVSAQVNVEMGCDMPDTIMYIDNRLTWGSTQWGICTLCSTVIEDERNVRIVSRNINGGNRSAGMLQETNLKNAVGINFEGKYIVVTNSTAWVWDYTIAPFSTSDRVTVDTAAKNTAWFKWDNMPITHAVVMNRELYYSRDNKLCMFTYTYDDFGEAIPAHFMTPMWDFGTYENLKTVKWIYIQTRGDTPSITQLKYITDEDTDGEQEPRDLIVNTRLWGSFQWGIWGWTTASYAAVFARKCRVKKFNLMGIYFWNDQADRDMTLSGLRLQYTIVKRYK